MKNIIIKTFAALLVASSMTSCSDFLDQRSESSSDGPNIFNRYESTQGSVAAIYDIYTATNYRGRIIRYGTNTDIEFYNSSKNSDAKSDLSTYSAIPSNSEQNPSNGTTLWGNIYAAIERANLAIEGLRNYSDLSSVKMKQLLGEALTLRALQYEDLIHMWGDVPVRFESVNASNMYPERVDRDIIYKQIIADLQEAQDLCAWPNEIDETKTVERVNKAFVKGLLARVCMEASGYAQRMDGENRLSTDPELTKEKLYPIALQACKDVMATEGTYVALKKNFEDIWNNNGISGDVIDAGSESLFEIGYSDGPTLRGRNMYTYGLKHNGADEMTDQAKGGEYGPTATLYYDYSAGDTRRDVTCCPFQWNKKGNQELQSFKTWNFGKLRYEWTNRKVPAGNDDGINTLVMRYADVVLMRAELENELNGPAAAAPYLEKIRKRAFGNDVSSYINKVSASKGSMFNAIVEERGLEFAGELIRKADLIRWGLLKTKLDETKAKMEALCNLTDYDSDHPYSQLSGHIYYKKAPFTWACGNISTTKADAKLVFYGLNYGELDLNPEGYDEYTDSEGKASTWIKPNALDDQKNYLYLNDPDKRQYWPFFTLDMNANENLHNYSWY